jgi:hypothetical protein
MGSTDVAWIPVRFGILVSINEGFQMLAVGPRQVMLVPIDLSEETTTTTEGGTEGYVLTWHTSTPPDWQPAAADVDLDGYVIGYWQTGDPGTPPQDEAIWFDTDATAQNVSDPSGTSFPSTPATNQRFWRTDIKGGMGFHYDGTRWLSDNEYQIPYFTNAAAATAILWGQAWDVAGLDVYLGRCENALAISTTNDGSNNWIVRVYSNDLASGMGGTDLLASSSSSNGLGLVTSGDRSFNVNSVVDVSANHSVAIFIEKVGSPGTMRIYGTLFWRYIAT